MFGTLLPGIICLLILYKLYTLFGPGSRKHKQIPGPTGLPLIGNALQLEPATVFQKWARQYGEIYQIKIGPFQRWVFLNSPRAVKDILEKKSAVTSSRPAFHSARIVSGNRRLVLMEYGPQWRTLRGIVHTLLTPKASSGFQPSQEFEATQVLWDIYRSSQAESKHERETEFYNHVRRYSASVMLTLVYGIRAPVWGANSADQIFRAMSEFSRVGRPVYGAIDVFPALLKLPEWMHWWKNDLKAREEFQNGIWLGYWNQMKEKIDRGVAPDCFGRQFVEAGYSKKGISEMQAAYVAGTMIEAGSDTTSSTLNIGIAYLCANPHVRAKAHEEISQIIGDQRSPTFDDRLPYVRAIVKEVMRIRSVFTFGGPHCTDADVEYDGYLIPKGTVVLLHQNGIQRDPGVYPAPDVFNPDRFLGHPGKASDYVGIADPYGRDHWSYGTGRRVCSGMHVAENSLQIVFSKLLWAFDMLPPLDDDGLEIPVDTSDDAFVLSGLTVPKPFKCRFVPRNSEVRDTLVREWKVAETEGFWLGDRKVDSKGIVA